MVHIMCVYISVYVNETRPTEAMRHDNDQGQSPQAKPHCLEYDWSERPAPELGRSLHGSLA